MYEMYFRAVAFSLWMHYVAFRIPGAWGLGRYKLVSEPRFSEPLGDLLGDDFGDLMIMRFWR